MISISTFLLKHKHMNLALIDQTMVSGVNFLTGILFARFLGVKEFGYFTLAWMTVLFVNSIQMAMISAPMMSIGPKQTKEETDSYYGAVVAHQLCFSLLSFGLIFLCIKTSDFFFPTWEIKNLAWPLALAAFFFQNQDFLRRFFFTTNRLWLAFISDGISYLGQIAILIILFLTTSMNTTKVLFTIASTSAFAIIFVSFPLTKLNWHWENILKVFVYHWNFSKWMTASALLQWTSGNLFIVAAGSILGATAVGAIKAAQNIMGISHILFQGLENIVPVRASFNYTQTGIKGLITYLKKVILWGGIATAIIAFSAGLLPEFWLTLFYGVQYQNFGFILQWYAIIYLLIFVGLPLRAGLRTLETTRPIFMAYVLMTIFTLFTAKDLIFHFGVNGVMFGIIGTQLILQLFLFVALNRTIKAAFVLK